MRVIAGTAKGTRLKAPKGLAVRPTADRVKEALFSIIAGQIPGCRFVDLFAGSGAVGIEALSRGAARCFFVEKDSSNIKLIRENLELTSLAEKAEVIRNDALRALKNMAAENNKANLFFIDPPYKSDLAGRAIEVIASEKLLAPGGLIVVEHAFKEQTWLERFPQRRQKKYGDTALTFIDRLESDRQQSQK